MVVSVFLCCLNFCGINKMLTFVLDYLLYEFGITILLFMFERIQHIKYLLILMAVFIAIGSLLISNYLISDLEKEERGRMEIWSEAMRSLNTADENTDLNLVLKVINGNHTIPVIVVDKNDEVLTYRNINKVFRA